MSGLRLARCYPASLARNYGLASRLRASTSTSTSTPASTRRKTSEAKEEEPGRINTDRGEYSKTGGDSAVAAQECSYEIRYHDPAEVWTASDLEGGRSGEGRPLEVSPANCEVSRFTDEGGGPHGDRGPSRRVSPRKGKRVDYGGADMGRE